MNKKIRAIGATILVVIWAVLTGFAWFGKAQAVSDTERRPLAQMPQLTVSNLLSGKFAGDFESYSLDQFPLRDGFRTVKSLFHYYVLNQKDNNGIYLVQGHAAKLESSLNTASVENAITHFNRIYETYLQDTDSKILMTVIPDKGYYLAAQNGYPSMDYQALFAMVEQGISWAEQVQITDCLTADSYYRTDTHWRQEMILPVAQKLSHALGVTAPQQDGFTATAVTDRFYGVYYGQAALPMQAETIQVMESDWIHACKVYDHETGEYTSVYNRDKLTSKDRYDVFLSGAKALLTIENPNAATHGELIVFRDSFGSSLVPLLLQTYETVTVVDTRYIGIDQLGAYVDFHGQDVLFAFSTSILNNSSTLK